MTFADRVIQFNQQLAYVGAGLPPGIRIMNPFREFAQTMGIAEQFYHKFYGDNDPRHIILGINPGRFGGGLTGLPFTDPKRLKSECGIDYDGKLTHEPSSVFCVRGDQCIWRTGSILKEILHQLTFPAGLYHHGC
jgi:hypothetical protein